MTNFTPIGVEAVVGGLSSFQKDLGKMTGSVDSMEAAIDELSRTVEDSFSPVLEEIQKQSKILSSILDRQVEPAVDGVGDESKETADDIKKMGESQERTEKKGRSWKDSLSSTINTISNVATAAIEVARVVVDLGKKFGEAAIGTVTMAADFQDSVTSLGIAAKTSGLSFDELHDTALQVGGDSRLLGVSATGAAESMTGLYKAGLTTTEIFGDLNAFMNEGAELGGALRASIDLAAATELDMVQASDLAAIALSTFGGNLETAEERAGFVEFAMNNLVQAADASVAEVSDLAEAIAMVGPSASQLGIGIDDTNNALALLSTAGISGSRAGSNLDAMLRSLANPTDAAQAALNELGITLFDDEGKFKDLGVIVAEFEGALKGTQTITQEVSTLTEQQAQELGFATKAYKQADDAITKHNLGLKVLSDKTLQKYQDQMVNAENVIVELGEGHTELITTTRELTEEQRNAALGAIFTAQGQRSMNVLLERGAEGWEEMAHATMEASSIQDQAAKKAATLSGQWEAFQGNLETFGIQIGEIFMPFAMQLVQWAADLASKYGPPIIEWAQETGQMLFNTLIPAIQNAGNWLGQVLPQAIQFVSDVWTNVLQPAIAQGADIWQTTVIPVLQTISSWFQQILPLAIDVVVTYWNTYLIPLFQSLSDQWTQKVQPALADLWAWLQERVPQAIETAAGFWEETLKPALATVAAFIIENVIPVIGDVVTWLIENIPTAIDTAASFWTETLQPALSEVWAFIQESVIPAIQDVVAWLQENIPSAIEEARRVWEDVLQPALKTVWEFIEENVIPVIETIAEWLEVNVPAAIETATNAWETILLPALEIVWGFMEESLFPMLEELADFLETVLAIAVEVLAGVWETQLKPALVAVWEYIDEFILPIFDGIRKLTEEEVQPVLEKFSEFLETGIVASLDRMAEGFKNATDFLVKFLNKIRKWRQTEVPEDFKPGSPPPLFYALADIGAAMADLSQVQIPQLTAQMAGLGRVTAGGVGGGTSITNNNNITMNATVSGGISAAAFQARTLRTVEGAIAA